MILGAHAMHYYYMCLVHFITINACCDNAFIISHEQVHVSLLIKIWNLCGVFEFTILWPF
jgi:hypothetical protein